MTPTQLYCKIMGHRFMPWSFGPTFFKGYRAQGGKCVRCHETLYQVD